MDLRIVITVGPAGLALMDVATDWNTRSKPQVPELASQVLIQLPIFLIAKVSLRLSQHLDA